MGTGDLCRVPQAAYAKKSQAKFRDETVWGLYKGPVGKYSGKICFIEKPGVQDEVGCHVAKHSSDPR